MTFTGILLVRSDRSETLDRPLNPSLAEWFYGIAPPLIESLCYKGEWFSLSEKSLFLDGRPLGTIEGQLLDVKDHPMGLIVLTDQALALISKEGEWVDRLQVGQTIPLEAPLKALKVEGGSVFLRSLSGVVESQDLLNWKKVKGESLSREEESIGRGLLPNGFRQNIERCKLGQTITWERFLLDLHSGRLLGGKLGLILVELSAWGLVLLTFSGLYIWFFKMRLTEKKSLE